MRLLHLYSPHAQHCDGYVIGTPSGLMALRNAIDRALKRQYSMTEVCCNDGEAYNILVVGVVTDTIENRLALPYIDDKDMREDAVLPHETLSTETYDRLFDQQLEEEDHG